MDIFGILNGGFKDKMAAPRGEANNKLPGSETVHKFSSNSSIFQAEALF